MLHVFKGVHGISNFSPTDFPISVDGISNFFPTYANQLVVQTTSMSGKDDLAVQASSQAEAEAQFCDHMAQWKLTDRGIEGQLFRIKKLNFDLKNDILRIKRKFFVWNSYILV